MSLFNLGQAQCTVCIADSYCPAGASLPIMCSPGTYSTTSASTCTNCPLGNYCLNGVPTTCQASTYSSSTGASVCTNCPIGNMCLQGATAPTPCTGST